VNKLKPILHWPIAQMRLLLSLAYPLKIPCIFFQIVFLCACDKAMGREQIHSTSLQILGKWSCLLEPYFYALTVLLTQNTQLSVSRPKTIENHTGPSGMYQNCQMANPGLSP